MCPYICIKLSVKAKHPHLNYWCGRPSVLSPNLLTIVILRTDPQGHFLDFGASFYNHTRTICTCIRLSLAIWTACKERSSILLHSTLLLVLLFLVWFCIHSSIWFVLIMINCERRYQKRKQRSERRKKNPTSFEAGHWVVYQ